MTLYFFLKWLHVIGATVFLGTGAGIAFFMVMAHRTRDPEIIAAVAAIVVLADYLFTLSAVIVQPITGFWLAHVAGYPLASGWIVASVGLYLFTGAFWVPVVFMQRRMRDLARHIRQAHEDVEKVQVTSSKISQRFAQIEGVDLDDAQEAAQIVELRDARESGA